MKSGPTFAGATARPPKRSPTISPLATVVLPTPEWVPATTRRGPSRISLDRCSTDAVHTDQQANDGRGDGGDEAIDHLDVDRASEQQAFGVHDIGQRVE